ncbi:HU family DNA-binding protein [Methyloceanibacter sp.]|uniref:HU family DNA-binding protein n=1 Tax=Methyloceanibacter sp. TaxID=1965321 RepID=UPI002CA82E67|nr:HU family DNA-binding protein [Methyloceanibacter sp.]HML92260.1 HU family DNA-binding protein [Methyloceanibacter sp.]
MNRSVPQAGPRVQNKRPNHRAERKDKAVNKAELVAQVAKESDLSKDAAEKAVDATFKNIEKALSDGDTVRIVGFGNFQVAQRKATTGRNPRTGAEVQIPASRVPKFRAGKALKEAVNA